MKRRSFVSLLSAVFARAQEPAQQATVPVTPETLPQSGFKIAGTVVNAATNTPIGKALVQIAATSNRGETREVVTGPDGRFSFANLAIQKFSLTVTRQSGSPQAYLLTDNYSSAIVTGPNQDTSNLIFRFHLPGTLAGTVLDENGDPVQSAQVHLFTHRIDEAGIRRMMPSGMNPTRSGGQFRFAHLWPGSYIVGVSGQPWFAQRNAVRARPVNAQGNPPLPPPDPQFDVVFPFTYYSNATDPAAASPVSITEGAEATIQLNVRAVPAIHVKLTGGDPSPGAGTNVQASLIGPEGHLIFSSNAGFAHGGQGELNGLAPGRYQLAINVFNAQPARPGSGEMQTHLADRSNFLRKIVDLVDGTVVDLSSASRNGLKATVTVVGNDRPQNRIGLLLRDSQTGNGINGMAGPDGTIRFAEANLSAGRYHVMLSNTPEFRVLSLEAKGAKVAGGEVIIEDGADVQLLVGVGRRSTVKIEGWAVRDKLAVVGAMVLLIPKVPAFGATTYRDQSDSDGSFAFNNVSAGAYFAVGISDGHDLAFGDPAVIQHYLTGAQSVTVNEATNPPPIQISVQQRVS